MTSVDTVGAPGAFPSIAVGADGLPVIAHQEQNLQDLKVAKCGSAICKSFWIRR